MVRMLATKFVSEQQLNSFRSLQAGNLNIKLSFWKPSVGSRILVILKRYQSIKLSIDRSGQILLSRIGGAPLKISLEEAIKSVKLSKFKNFA